MAFPMVSQILLFLFQNTQQHSKLIAKKYFLSKERFCNDKRFISLHFEDDQLLLGFSSQAFKYH